ncbi:shikimate kinase AroK [Algiphilus sp.]|nr:shikimate kinase AroK [Algiphilus sp.]MCI5063610.1 shikimate kinase AroK [Algiphilus sp.]MCI5104618.1 shikimate kinase AroK [Algiphilus sp.]MCR9092179.1 shikimate kinase AroK [Pseudomonadota bacterium]
MIVSVRPPFRLLQRRKPREERPPRAALHRRIFLVGPMGSGKTTLGRRLAALSRMEFVDSDHEIERRTGVDIPFIFEKEGEAGFRRREHDVLAELAEREGVVVATGGGAVLNADTRRRLHDKGLVIYLHASVDQQLRRTARSSHRPLLRSGDRRATLERLLAERDPLYREIAHRIVKTDGRNTRALAQEIFRNLRKETAES